MDEEYICILNGADLQRANDELNEDPRNRLGAVRKLREWIEEQSHISFPTGNFVNYMQSTIAAEDTFDCISRFSNV